MNTEREKLIEAIEVQEDVAALDYLARRGLALDSVFDRNNYAFDFYDVPYDVIEGDYGRILSHGLVSKCFPGIPGENLWGEAEKLAGGFEQVKAGLLLSLNKPGTNYTNAEKDALSGFCIEDVAKFADEVSKRFIDIAGEEAGKLSIEDARLVDASALYWLRVRSVAMAALSVASEYEDPAA